LVGYPQDIICDPSDLTVSELYALRDSLEKGTCTFKRLPDADRVELQAMVDEQVENGENPYGKRKRRKDAGKSKSKSKKKRKLSKSTVDCGSTHPPSDSDEDTNEDTDEDTPNDIVHPEIGLGQQRKIVHKRALNAPRVAQCSSSISTTAIASSIAHGAGIAAPVSATPSTGVGATTTAHSEQSTRLPKVLPARGFVNSSDDLESGEEFESEDDDDDDDNDGSIPYLRGSPKFREWDD